MLRATAVIYGMYGAVMIAAEACGAPAVMLPLRHQALAALYIGHGAHLGTTSATHAPGLIHPERPVGDKVIDEESAHRTAEKRRQRTHGEVGDARFASLYLL